ASHGLGTLATASAVGSAEITDASIATADIADSAITTAKISDGTIANADISTTATIVLSKLASGTSAQIIVGDATGVPTYVALSGDATISNAGALSIASNVVNQDELAATITFADADLVDLSSINASGTGEGLKLPQATSVSSATAEGQISWDTDNDLLYVGTGAAVTQVSNPFGTAIDLGGAEVTGTLGVGNGGTGSATTFTQGSVVFAGASGVYSQDNSNLFWDDTNDELGIGTASPAGMFDISKAKSGTPSASVGPYLSISTSTFTDNNTAASSTATGMVFNSIAVPTLAATNTSVTTTDAATLYIAGAPSAGSNQTISNAHALWVDAGGVRLDGAIGIGGTEPSAAAELFHDPDISQSSTYYGIFNRLEQTSTGDVVAMQSSALHDATNDATDVSNLYGLYATAGSGADDTESGDVTNAYAVYGDLIDGSSSNVTITNGYAIYAGNIAGNATITNAYGVYIEDFSSVGGTTDYSIYSAGGEARLTADNIQTTVTDVLSLHNSTAAATGSLAQYSPTIRFHGSSCDTNAQNSCTDSQNMDFKIYNTTVQHLTAPSARLTFDYSKDDAAFATAMIIDTSGNVGIGETSPEARLHVVKSAGIVAVFDRSGTSDGTILSFEQDDTEQGNITVSSGSVTLTAFTGGHAGWSNSDRKFQFGEVLIATGNNKTLHDRPFGKGEPIYEVNITDQTQDKRVLGVYAGPFTLGGETWILVHAVGNGFILVTDTNGNIEVGDYITSSGRAGYGQRQDEEVLANYTVCKSMMNVDWNEVPVDLERGFKWKLITCTYTAG
ncbi:MAG: hypothetical protein HY538_04810, partial [Deltaproteobacteria bacterium]|nr:hypothetical protein [Deltaproteobacteria bacterium]